MFKRTFRAVSRTGMHAGGVHTARRSACDRKRKRAPAPPGDGSAQSAEVCDFSSGGFFRDPDSEPAGPSKRATTAEAPASEPPSAQRPAAPPGTGASEDSDIEHWDIEGSDVMLAVQMAIGQFAHLTPRTCTSFALLTHVKAKLYGTSCLNLEKELVMLQSQKRIVVLKLSNSTQDRVVTLHESFIAMLDSIASSQKAAKDAQAVRLLRVCVSDGSVRVEVTQGRLCTLLQDAAKGLGEAGFARDAATAAVRMLIQSGLLVPRNGIGDASMLRLSMPGVGSVAATLDTTRREITGLLKRHKKKEAVEKNLVANNLRSSKLGWRFHLEDMQGVGLVDAIENGNNRVFRLAKR